MNTNTCSCGGTPHTDECYFGHFLAYTGFAGESPEIIEKLKKAYFDGIDAGRPHDPEKATGSGELPASNLEKLLREVDVITWPGKTIMINAETTLRLVDLLKSMRQAIAQCGDRRDAGVSAEQLAELYRLRAAVKGPGDILWSDLAAAERAKNTKLKAESTALREQAAMDREDAELYRWLESKVQTEDRDGGYHRFYRLPHVTKLDSNGYHPTLSEGIRAAIAKEQGK